MAGKRGSNPPQCRSVTRAGKRCSRRGAGGLCVQHRDGQPPPGGQRRRGAASREADRDGTRTPDLVDMVLEGDTTTIPISEVERLMERVGDLQSELNNCERTLRGEREISRELERLVKGARQRGGNERRRGSGENPADRLVAADEEPPLSAPRTLADSTVRPVRRLRPVYARQPPARPSTARRQASTGAGCATAPLEANMRIAPVRRLGQ